MERINLIDADGTETAKHLPIDGDPEIIIWGRRAYQLQTITRNGEPTTYREVTSHWFPGSATK